MAENIALQKSSQNLFTHAVKNIKELIKSGEIKVKQTGPVVDKKKTVKPVPRSKGKLRVFRDRGVVYLSHIPHGFYEDQMKEFFAQFGHVTRLRLSRSHKTGKSRGFAFVEFRFTEVAKVVAETMNNYLMGNRLLKAKYIPPEEQNPKTFLHSVNYGPETCIGLINRKRAIKEQNKKLPTTEAQARVNRHKLHLTKLQEKLKAQGVDFVFQVDNTTSDRLSQEVTSSSKPSTTGNSSKEFANHTLKKPMKRNSDAVLGKALQKSKKVKSLKTDKTVKKIDKPQKIVPAPEKKGLQKQISVKKAVPKPTTKTHTVKKDVKKLTKKK